MRYITVKNYDELSTKAAALICAQVNVKPNCVLGLATGSSPLGTYAKIIEKCANGEVDFSEVTSINLDEYMGLDGTHDQSYRYFMNTKLFDHVNVNKENTHVPNGSADDAAAEAARYEAFVRSLGGADIQILGIGRNGHIAFNEPAEALYPATHVTGLTEDTIDANARFFASADEVPTKALTMGMGTILSAKKIIILANGKGKHEAVSAMLSGMVTTSCPASFLNLHADVTLICDHAAYEG